MSIEFIGLPGTGKSYLYSRMSEVLQRMPSPVPVATYPPIDSDPRAKLFLLKLLRAAFFVMRHPAAACHFLSLMRRSQQVSRRAEITKALNLFSEIGRKEWSGKTILAREQGVLQAIWSVALEAKNPDIGGLVRAASPYLPILVVHVEADRSEQLRRLEGRTTGHSRLDRMPRERREMVLRNGEALFSEIIAEWMQRQPNHCYLRIQNTDGSDTGELVGRILAAMPVIPVAAKA